MMENNTVFNDFSHQELFEYLLDNLIIPPDSEYSEWRYYHKGYMEIMAEDFYERNVNVEI